MMSVSPITSKEFYASHITTPVVEAPPRWVRVKFGGEIIADSKRGLLLRHYGPDRLLAYYFPQADARMETLSPGSYQAENGEVAYWTVKVRDQVAENATWTTWTRRASWPA